jgi:hypothetical protein
MVGTRYHYEQIAQEVIDFCERHGRGTQKALAIECGWEEPAFSKHLRGKVAWFDIEEWGEIAEAVQKVIGKPAPPYWPFVPWHVGEALRRGAH